MWIGTNEEQPRENKNRSSEAISFHGMLNSTKNADLMKSSQKCGQVFTKVIFYLKSTPKPKPKSIQQVHVVHHMTPAKYHSAMTEGSNYGY